MTRRSTLALVALTSWSLASAANASCDVRPGTPDRVTATARDTHDEQGRRLHTIVLEWRNTANSGEQVWWDTEITDLAKRPIGLSRPGGWHPSSLHHEILFNTLRVASGESRCFRIRARTAPATEGCVSANWSPWACATSAPPPGAPSGPSELSVQ